MLDRDKIPVIQQFLVLRENERSVSIDPHQYDDIFQYFKENQTPWRPNFVFDGVIVDQNVASNLPDKFKVEDKSQEVRDFLAQPKAVRIIGGNIHSMVLFESGSDLMFRVDPQKTNAEPLPDNLLILRMDETFEQLPLPKQYETMDEAIKAYRDYAIPAQRNWLDEQWAKLNGHRSSRSRKKAFIMRLF